MQLLDDLHGETRRLFIAGSRLAKGDPRVMKFIPALEKLGEKAPIMKRLADKYTALTESGEPAALAEAGTLLYAVMATQGKTEISGEETEVEAVIKVMPKTEVPHSRLRPIIEALTTSRQGRLEVLTKAHEEGQLRDFRLYDTLVSALDDKYTAIGDYLCDEVLPSLGETLIPYLLEQYDRDGKSSDARKLLLLHRLRYSGVEKLALDAAENGSAAVAPEGIRILGYFPGNEEYLLKLSGDKKAAIREAALTALIAMESASGYEIMMKSLRGSKYKSAIEAAQLCQDSGCVAEMLGLLKSRYEELLTVEGEKEFRAADGKLTEMLGVLKNKYTPEVIDFCLEFLRDKRYQSKLKGYKMSYYAGVAFSKVCDHLTAGPPEHMLPIYEEIVDMGLGKLHHGILTRYFRVAADYYPTERLYHVFAPYYDLSLLGFDEMFMPMRFTAVGGVEKATRELLDSAIDERWVPHFIKRHDMKALSVMLTEDSPQKQAIKDEILRAVKKAADKGQGSSNDLGSAVGRFIEITDKKKGLIFKGELEKLAETCYLALEKGSNSFVSYFFWGIGKENFLKLFYPEYKEKFEAIAAKKSGAYMNITSLFAEAASGERN